MPGPSRHHAALLTLSCALLAGCTSDGPADRQTIELDFREAGSAEQLGWEPGFSDYGVEQEEIMEFASGHKVLPDDLAAHGHGLMVGATNRSDDVFMYWTGPVTGLAPETSYSVDFQAEFATDSPSGCAGIGGSPGESVFVKAGITTERPEREVIDEHWRMTIDKGNQAIGGTDAVILGTVGNKESDCATTRVWEFKTLQSDTPFILNTDASGTGWLIVGSDSGFEGRTELFYTRLRAELVPR